MPPVSAQVTSPRIAILAKVVAVGAYIVVVWGMTVVSTRSGLADEGWPLFSGRLLPSVTEMSQDRGKFYEHGHRAIAGTLGILTIALAIALGPLEPRRWVRRLGIGAAIVVVVLAGLGGATVLLKLPAEVSILHVSIALFFASLTTTLAIVTGRGWQEAEHELATSKGLVAEDARWLHLGALLTLVSIYLQAILGAVPRHLYHGAIPHIIGAFVVFTAVVMVSTRVLGRHAHLNRLLGPSMLLLALVVVQFFLGFTAFIVRPEVAKAPGTSLYELSSASHAAVGALMVIAAVIVYLRAARFAHLVKASAPAAPEGGAA
jgi:heme A synthase